MLLFALDLHLRCILFICPINVSIQLYRRTHLNVPLSRALAPPLYPLTYCAHILPFIPIPVIFGDLLDIVHDSRSSTLIFLQGMILDYNDKHDQYLFILYVTRNNYDQERECNYQRVALKVDSKNGSPISFLSQSTIF